MKKNLLLLLTLSCFAQFSFAQNKVVKGSVLDTSGYPIIGATIKIVGSNQATVTDMDGNFTIQDVNPKATINVSYIGMQPQTLKVTDNLKVVLNDDFQNLNDVVVIGYGSAKAKDLTSPITVIKADDIKSTPSSSPMSALQGKVAGVNVVNSGTPGAGPTVRVRGVGSFGNSSPLYVVDGMFYDDINFINNDDIQDMTILKDASAAAIYGVRAANGVVLITTKKGVKNQSAKITYDGYVGIQKATNVLKMANSSQYATMLMEANFDAYSPMIKNSIDRFGGSYADSDFHKWTYGANTDWYDELLRTAVMTNHSIGISGGSDKSTYSLGMSYLAQDGIMDVKNNYKRLNFRAAIDYDATKWLKVGFNGIFSQSSQILPNNTAWQQAFNTPGLIPVYDNNNENAKPEKYASPKSIGLSDNFKNPVATANYYDSKNDLRQYMTNFYAQLNIVPEKLTFKTSINYNYQNIDGRTFVPTYYVESNQQSKATSLTKTNTQYNNYIWDNTLTYKDSFGKHNFGAMLGTSMRQETYKNLWGSAPNVPEGNDSYLYLGQGSTTGITLGDDGTKFRGLSYFARLNYDFDSKYYLMFTMRADGSSKYQDKWGYFPSVGASWVISEESWMTIVR